MPNTLQNALITLNQKDILSIPRNVKREGSLYMASEHEFLECLKDIASP